MSTSTQKVANTALKIVSSPARRSGRLPSPAEEQAQVNLALVSTSWQGLDLQSQQTFNFLGQSWSPNPKKATASGFSVYKSLNLARIAMGEDLLTACPQHPDPVASLPSFTLEATVTSTNVFVLSAHSDAFSGIIQVTATRPKSPGTTRFRADQGRVLQTITGLIAGSTPLAAGYMSVFPQPAVGTRLCVFMTPISPNGFRGVTRRQEVIVTRLLPAELVVE